MEYVKYLNFGYDIATVVFHITTIFFTCHVIYCSKFDKKSAKLGRISNSFFVFLASRGFGAMLALPYPVYLAVYWTAEGKQTVVIWSSVSYALLCVFDCLLVSRRKMPAPAYIPYLNYAETWLTIAVQLFSIVLMSNLIYCHCTKSPIFAIRSRLSPSMLVYLCTHVVLSSLALPYNVYYVSHWQAPMPLTSSGPVPAPLYNAQILYWMGIWMHNYTNISPMPVLLLIVDRMLILQLSPARYDKQARSVVVWTAVALIVAVTIAMCVVFLLELPLDMGKVGRCENITCTMQKYRALPHLFTKLVVSMANLIGSFIFFILLVKKSGPNNGPATSKKKNQIVKYTIVSEIFMSVLPTYFAYIFSLVMGESSANYFGQYLGLLVPMDAAFCAIIYSTIMLRWRSRKIMITNPLFCEERCLDSAIHGRIEKVKERCSI